MYRGAAYGGCVVARMTAHFCKVIRQMQGPVQAFVDTWALNGMVDSYPNILVMVLVMPP